MRDYRFGKKKDLTSIVYKMNFSWDTSKSTKEKMNILNQYYSSLNLNFQGNMDAPVELGTYKLASLVDAEGSYLKLMNKDPDMYRSMIRTYCNLLDKTDKKFHDKIDGLNLTDPKDITILILEHVKNHY